MVKAARNAMATRFEIVLYGENEVSLRAAAEEALDEIERIENKLSLYRPDSEIAHLNARAASESVRVSPELFRLLEQIKALHEETDGAFDITIGPLMQAWGFVGGTGEIPDPQELESARRCVGMNLVEFDVSQNEIRFSRPGVMLDLGSVGKGYAIERAVEILREAGVTSALMHGGTSTSYGIGKPPDQEAWKIAIERPVQSKAIAPSPQPSPPIGERESAPSSTPALLAVVPLMDSALSVSAVWGKSFSDGKITYGHILDPRTGAPANNAILAAVSIASATESDALSTALLTLGIPKFERVSSLQPQMRTLVVEQSAGNGLEVRTHGIQLI